MSQTPLLDGPHWQFSLAVYGEPDVATTCLMLQNEFKVDVNILLLAAWATSNGLHLDAADIALLDDEMCKWRADVIAPLRSVRVALKNASSRADRSDVLKLREQVKEIELIAEQIEQVAIAGWLESFGRSRVSVDEDPEERIRKSLLRVIDHFRDRAVCFPAQDRRLDLEAIVVAVRRHGRANVLKGERNA